ncbi:MAG: hypothetical protein HRT34_08715 [Alcanivorax sp.]|nr:hypothetical protein [Alcanivorax sp.]NRB70945.1 hypothetical protein [Xanthomonadales bacterium]
MTPLAADVFSGAYSLIDCGPPLFCICPGIPLSLFLRGISIRFLGVMDGSRAFAALFSLGLTSVPWGFVPAAAFLAVLRGFEADDFINASQS